MNNSLEYLNELTWEYRASRVLQIAVRVDLFTKIDGNEYSCDQIAEMCSAKTAPLEKFLIACCSMGLLQSKDGLYSNSELAETYLVEGKPLYQGNIIAHASNVWDYWDQLDAQILNTPLPDDETESHRNFILGMKNITLGGRGKIFTDNIDLSGRKKMLDVGGGPGTYSILACEKYPDLTAAVFDLPETIAIAEEMIADAGMQNRITTIKGSWENDDFGNGWDVVLFSNVLHGPESQTDMKLKKAYEAMQPGGLLLIQEFLLNDNKTGPMVPALFNLMVGAYSQTEILKEILEAGFKNPKISAENQKIGCTWVTAEK